jgi:amidase
MYAVPDEEEVKAVAKELGIHLGPEEVGLYRKYLLETLASLDEFVQSRIEEVRPPMESPARQPGYRPSATEDPLNAWTWKCRIEGAPDGLLAGKTVSYKDHIAVAGIPMSVGSFALEGNVPDFDATIVTRVLQAGGTIIGKNTMNGLSARGRRWRRARSTSPSAATKADPSASPPPCPATSASNPPSGSSHTSGSASAPTRASTTPAP